MQVEWCRLTSGSHAVAMVDGILHVWDLAAARLLYRIEGMSASEPPVFSGSQLYMMVPQAGSGVIVETATGKIRRVVPTGSTLKPGGAFHPNGRLLALSFSNQYRVWDCEQHTVVSEATTTDHLGSHPLWWVAPGMFRTPLGSTVDIELGMAVWKYTTSVCTPPVVVGSKLVTATTSTQCDLVSVTIPHAAAEEAVDKLMQAGDAAMLVRPGSHVAMAVEASAPWTRRRFARHWRKRLSGQVGKVVSIAHHTCGQDRPGGHSAAEFSQHAGRTAHYEHGPTDTLHRGTADPSRRDRPVVASHGQSSSSHVVSEGGRDGAGCRATLREARRRVLRAANLPPRIPKPEVSAVQIGMSVLKDGHWQDLKGTVQPRGRRR